MVLVVLRKQMVEHGNVAVVREAQVLDASGFALLHQEVEHAIVHVAGVQRVHSTHAYAVQQVVVDVAHLQFLH